MLMAKILSYSVLVVWLLGSYSHKMIGVQTLNTFQFIAVSQAFAVRYFPVVKYFNEFSNTLNLYQNSFSTSSNLSSAYFNRLNYNGDFVSNCAFILLAQLCVMVLFTIFKFLKKNDDVISLQPQKKKSRKKSCKNKPPEYKDLLYNFLVFPLFVGFYFNFVISLIIYSFPSNPKIFISINL